MRMICLASAHICKFRCSHFLFHSAGAHGRSLLCQAACPTSATCRAPRRLRILQRLTIRLCDPSDDAARPDTQGSRRPDTPRRRCRPCSRLGGHDHRLPAGRLPACLLRLRPSQASGNFGRAAQSGGQLGEAVPARGVSARRAGRCPTQSREGHRSIRRQRTVDGPRLQLGGGLSRIHIVDVRGHTFVNPHERPAGAESDRVLRQALSRRARSHSAAALAPAPRTLALARASSHVDFVGD